MKIITDSGTDLSLSPKQLAELDISIVPLVVTFEGKSSREGVDIVPDEFYVCWKILKAFPAPHNHRSAAFPKFTSALRLPTLIFYPYICPQV
jgi:hypothetical protein